MLAPLRARVGAVGPALGLLALIGFVAQVGIAVMLPLLPLFATELGASPFVLGLLTSAFAVTNGLGQLGAGPLTNRVGSRRFLAGGLALYASMNALITTAATAFWLVTRGRVFGIVSAVSNAGIVIGATSAGILWERVDIGVAMLSGGGAIILAMVPLSLLRVPRRG